MRERAYQKKLIDKLHDMLPGCLILKNDSAYVQGIPDIAIFYGDKWGMLEVKADAKAPSQPNQEHYIEMLDDMSFAAIIYPENEEEVLGALQQALGARRKTRVSKPK